MKFRIKAVVLGDGKIRYYPQQKNFLFWRNLQTPHTSEFNYFHNGTLIYEEAEEAILEIRDIILHDTEKGSWICPWKIET